MSCAHSYYFRIGDHNKTQSEKNKINNIELEWMRTITTAPYHSFSTRQPHTRLLLEFCVCADGHIVTVIISKRPSLSFIIRRLLTIFVLFFLFFISRSRVLCMFLFTFPVILPTHSTVFRRYICICMYNVYMSDPDYCNIIRLSHTHSDSPPSLFIKLIVVNSPTTKEEKVIQNRLSSSR